MEATKAILTAIRNELIGSATLIAIVPTAQIARANQQAKSVYPYISIRVEGGNEDTFDTVISGAIYFTIYAKTANATNGQIGDYLDDLYGMVKTLIHHKPIAISDSNIRIDNIYESFKGGATLEDDIPTLYYIAARYNYIAHSQ